MNMKPWNLTHSLGQWSKNLTMASDILESAPWSMPVQKIEFHVAQKKI